MALRHKTLGARAPLSVPLLLAIAAIVFVTSTQPASSPIDPVPVAVTSYTLFGSRTPTSAPDPDTGAVELGVRFQASSAGVVSGVRFHKGWGNSGTHTGSLWTNSGTRLATGTFTNETNTGWQTLTFASPVAVQAGTTYVASYHTTRGRYSADTGAFRSTGMTQGPLTALRDGQNGSNSVYAYSGSSTFPRSTWKATNYWVDVTFQTGTASTTTTRPPTTVAPTTSTTRPATTTVPPSTTTTRPPTATTVAPTTTTTRPPTTTTVAPTTTTTRPPTTTTTTTTPPTAGMLGWQLTNTNVGLAGVGVNRSSLPAFNGSISAGQTISNVSITTCVDLSGKANVTLNRVYIHPSGCLKALILGPGTVIKDSDIDGVNMAPGQERFGVASQPGVGTNGNYTVHRVNITGMSVGMYLDSANSSSVGTVTETYIHGMLSTNGSHLDGITRRAGTGPLNVLRSRIAIDYSGSGGTFATGAFFMQDTYGNINGVSLKDSYLEGNGFPIEIEARFGNSTHIVSFNNVRIRATEKAATYNQGATIGEWANVYNYSATAPNNAGSAISKP